MGRTDMDDVGQLPGLEQTDQLQPGEDPHSVFTSDAVHWYGDYSALLELAVASDLPRKATWFSQRREFWRGRWKELRDRGT